MTGFTPTPSKATMRSAALSLAASALLFAASLSLLVGASFAWFTDTVANTHNVIRASDEFSSGSNDSKQVLEQDDPHAPASVEDGGASELGVPTDDVDTPPDEGSGLPGVHDPPDAESENAVKTENPEAREAHDASEQADGGEAA